MTKDERLMEIVNNYIPRIVIVIIELVLLPIKLIVLFCLPPNSNQVIHKLHWLWELCTLELNNDSTEYYH